MLRGGKLLALLQAFSGHGGPSVELELLFMINDKSDPNTAQMLAASVLSLKTRTFPIQTVTRSVSSSPYGRTHVWKRRPPKLPSPMVPQFPQRVIRSDGTTFTHWTTSPRSVIRLTRDVTNNPLWNSALVATQGVDEEDQATGRLGRFQRRFEGSMDLDWMETGDVGLEPAAGKSEKKGDKKK